MHQVNVRTVVNRIYVTIRGGISGGSSTVVWGGIIGTLSAQTDLQNALNLKATVAALLAHTSDLANPHAVTKSQVGLGNADNTSDANKPVSTAQQVALDLKANSTDLLAHTTNTSNPHSVTKSQVGLGNADNTSDANKPVSTAQQTALDLKIDLTQKAANNGVATLDGGGKIPASQLPNTVMEFQGVWNASTNTPTLADGAGNAGDVYLVSVAGTRNLGSGSQTFAVGDWVVYNGSIWQKSINSNSVVSVNGQQGVVVLSTSDILEGSNQYYTDERVDDRVAVLIQNGTGITWTYNDASNTLTGNLNSTQSFANLTVSGAGAASAPSLSITGAAYTAGTGTTNTPLVYINNGASAPTTWAITGTYFGINAASGFTGNFIDLYVNGGSTVFRLQYSGALAIASTYSGTGMSMSGASGLSAPQSQFGGTTATGGTATTTTPHIYRISTGASGPTSWSTAGTTFGINEASGFAGNFLDFHVNGGSSLFKVTSAGDMTANAISATSVNATGGVITAAIFTSAYAAAGNQSVFKASGTLFTGGTGTSNLPQWFAQSSGTAVTTWSTAGTYFGINANSGFTGNFIDVHINGGASLFSLTNLGTGVFGGGIIVTTSITGYNFVASGNATTSISPVAITGSIVTGGTGTTNIPHLRIEPSSASAVTTWSTSGTAIGINTASGFVGNFLDFHLNGSGSYFSVNYYGLLTINANTSIGGNAISVNASITAAGDIYAGATRAFAFGTTRSEILSPSDGTIQLINAAATGFTRLQLGIDVASPSATTLQGASVIAGTTNTAGANLSIAAGQGTGTGAGGSLLFQVAPAGSTGSTQNALATVLTIASTKIATFSDDVQISRLGIGTPASGSKLKILTTSLAAQTLGSDNTSSVYQQIGNGNGSAIFYYGIDSSTGGTLFTGGPAFSSGFGTGNATAFVIATNNTVRVTVASTGNVTFTGAIFSSGLVSSLGYQIGWNGQTAFFNQSDGVLTIANNAGTDFGRLQLGGTTSSFPAIKRNTTGIDFRLADDSGYTFITAGTIELGAASDTTLSRVSAGVVAIEGATIATLSAAQTFTATNTHKQIVWTANAITASGNAATIPITHRLHNVTNNSAATLTITMTTTSAVDGALEQVRIFDFSAVAQTITWVNTENGEATAPATSNGSTTLPRTALFQYNAATSKWRCIAS